MSKHVTHLAVTALLSFTSLNSEAALTPLISAGQSVVYSSVSGLTWTGDANLLGTLESTLGFNTVVNAIIAASPNINDSGYGHYTLSTGDFNSAYLGSTNWFGAKAFTNYLNSIDYAGINLWTSPSLIRSSRNSFSSQLSELYSEMGGNTSYFSNEQAGSYWLGTEYDGFDMWGFNRNGGGWQGGPLQVLPKHLPVGLIWAVAPVPVTGPIWLFGSGLLGLLSLKRRRHAG